MKELWTTRQSRTQETRAPVTNAWQHLPGTYLSELLASSGADVVTLDMQHGMIDINSAKDSILAIEARGSVPFVRLPREDPALIVQLLDAGAVGLICPTIESVAQASAFVSASYYPPVGRRSYGPNRAVMSMGSDYFSSAKHQVFTFAMIETVAGLECVEEIAAIPALTGLFIGPGDLGISMGLPPMQDRTEPEIVAAINRVATAADSAGKRTGIHASTPEYAADMANLGFDLVTIMSDAPVLSAAARSAVASFHKQLKPIDTGQ